MTQTFWAVPPPRGVKIAAALLLALCAALPGARGEAVLADGVPVPSAFDPALVQRGAALAAIGNCRGCHTTRGGEAFAGGLAMRSPFGTIYSTNITPDAETGIGRWSEAAFRRALREGIRNDGCNLYPAFPYDRFTRVTDEDIHALYAYLMAQPPVRRAPPANRLAFPFNVRATVKVWNAMFLRVGPRAPDASRGAVAARGEYLVEGLGHCASCHTPRNAMFAEKRGAEYDGGDQEGWHAYAINSRIAAPIPWDADSLTFYLSRGYHPQHGISRGPMGLVTEELAHAPTAEVRAMAEYLVALMGPASEARRSHAAAVARDPLAAREGHGGEGAQLYAQACEGCHDGSRPLPYGGVPLARSLAVSGESPRNLINVIVNGLDPAEGEPSPSMPGFEGAMSDVQVATLVRWLRANLSERPPWQDFSKLIGEAHRMDFDQRRFPPGGSGIDPAAAR
jgi:mono/diheme cytochrome c family protein